MPPTPLSDVKSGDVLTQPASTPTGMVLLPAGTELTDRHLERLAAVGVVMVSVRRTGPEAEAEALAKRQAIEDRFLGHEHDPLMQELKTLVLSQLEQTP